MRGEDRTSGALFSYVDVEARIAANHPLRAMRRLINAALAELDPRFSGLYEGIGRPSIAPERLLRAVLLQLLYSIRSERQLVERLEFDMLFRWFVGLMIDEKVFDASTFSKNRDRLLTHEIAQEFLSSLLGLPEVKGLLSAEHFSVDGTMLKAWASMKSFRPKGASDEGPEIRPGRSASTGAQWRSRLSQDEAVERDPRLDDGQGCAPFPQRRRTGEPSGLSWPRLDGEPQRARGGGRGDAGDRNGRTRGGGAHEPALAQGATLGADKGYDAEAFVEGLKARGIEPHVAINGTVSKHGKARKTAVPSEVAASVRYAISQRLRKRIEEGFGWTKTVGGLTQVKVRGLAKVRAAFVFAMAAYNIVRLPKLYGPDGRSASRDMKSQRTMTQSPAKTSK